MAPKLRRSVDRAEYIPSLDRACWNHLMRGPGKPFRQSSRKEVSLTTMGPLKCFLASVSLALIIRFESNSWISGKSRSIWLRFAKTLLASRNLLLFPVKKGSSLLRSAFCRQGLLATCANLGTGLGPSQAKAAMGPAAPRNLGCLPIRAIDFLSSPGIVSFLDGREPECSLESARKSGNIPAGRLLKER